jgi:hypothetical protein
LVVGANDGFFVGLIVGRLVGGLDGIGDIVGEVGHINLQSFCDVHVAPGLQHDKDEPQP